VIGIAGNLGLIGYFKYANFFVNELNSTLGMDFHLQTIILPLAISFFTFQQVAYLVDVYKGKAHEYSFLHYCLFVTFFPQLIAGPIVHHKEMLPQFAKDKVFRLSHEHLAVGITIFTIGLFKKVLLADGVAVYATPVFNAAEAGVALTFFEAWGGALAYTFQLYFDFSGYSDMAIGLARMFGIRLPLNFHSPYKAYNIIEFWRRWHMTLSRFFRDYLYIPLGGNQKGTPRSFLNLMITMVLGGLWHGAGWTFVLWGALHGFYLIVNHAWHALRHSWGHDLKRTTWFGRGIARIITFAIIVVAWVLFRAETLPGAVNVLSAMGGGNGISLSSTLEGKLGILESWILLMGGRFDGMFHNGVFGRPFLGIMMTAGDQLIGMAMIAFLLVLAWYAPNTQQIMIRYNPAFEIYHGEIKEWHGQWLQWKPNRVFGVLLGIAFLYTALLLTRVSEFLYFQF